MNELNNDIYSLGKLFQIFKDCSIIVPELQRKYVWNREQWQCLWNDLMKAMEEDKWHFLGTIVLRKSEDGNNKYELLDGQQRFTTILTIWKP